MKEEKSIVVKFNNDPVLLIPKERTILIFLCRSLVFRRVLFFLIKFKLIRKLLSIN
jgi:hypothetical protein